MKNVIFGTVLLASMPIAAHAAVLSESFEDSAFPQSWIVRSAQGCTKGVWSLEDYSTLADFTSNRIAVPTDAGTNVAMSTTGGISVMSKVSPDSWLISPALSLSGTSYLKFYYSFNLAYNSNVNLSAAQKAKFSVLISTTGTDAADFTDEVFVDVGEGLGTWRQICVDLSKYSGKTVYVAFRNYNEELHETASSMITQKLYLDNVVVDNTPAYDVVLSLASEFASGTVQTQPLSITVKNYGNDVSSFVASYTIDDNKTVSETVSKALRHGESCDYTFSESPNFTTAGAHTVVINASVDNDVFTANNILTRSVTIAGKGELPATPSDSQADLVSTLSGSVRKPAGWTYFEDYSSWIYTEAGAPAYLYTANSYHLAPGVYSVDFGYTSSSATAQLDLYAFKSVGDYGSPIASKVLAQSVEDITLNTLVFEIKQEEDYLLGFSLSGMSKNEQVTLPLVHIYEAASTPDIAVKEILSPKGSVVGGSYNVTATFSNDGGGDAVNVPVNFSLGSSTASAVIDAIKSGESVTYTFPTKVTIPSSVGDYQLTVEANISTDSNTANNKATSTISVYSPLALPWSDSFENDDDVARWTVANPDNNMTYWGISDEYAWDGDNIMLLNAFNSTEQNDWLISPALKFTSTDVARVSFYYGNANNSLSRARVSVYLAQSIDPEEIDANGSCIDSFDDAATYLSYFSGIVKPTSVGTYYVAVHVDGGYEEFYVDDFKVDHANEVYIADATCSAAEAAYSVDDATVTVTVVNGGVSNLSNVKVGYNVGIEGSDDVVYSASEVIDNIPAGQIEQYTFNKKLNLSDSGVYQITAFVSHDSDSDTRNNSTQIPNIHVLDVKTVPYVAGFEDENDEYAVMLGGKWELSSLGVYNGYASLYMSGKASDQTNGDWAILHKLYLEPGTYSFSFFWRTTPGGPTDSYKKNVSIYLGTAPEVAKMTKLLYEGKDLINTSYYAQKELSTFTVDQAGYYYVGVKNTSTENSGYIAIDDITIKKPDYGISVGYGDAAYKSDFENNDGEWYRYHPTSNIGQWSKTTDDTGTYYSVSEYNDWSGVLKTTSYFEAPALRLTADNNYTITVDYAINPFLSSNPIGTENALGVYASTIDNPSEFELIASLKEKGKKTTANIDYSAQTTGAYYFSLRPITVDEVTYTLYSFAVANKSADGISDVAIAVDFNVNARTITANGTIEVFNLQGALVTRANGSATLQMPGVYIVRVGNNVRKIIVK
jgi:hypothetical protein